MSQDTPSSKRCPKHPEQETLVPCLGCGRDFCRICEPPRGAGQYCPACYEKTLGDLKSKKEGPKPRAKARRASRKPARMDASGKQAAGLEQGVNAEKAGGTDKAGRTTKAGRADKGGRAGKRGKAEKRGEAPTMPARADADTVAGKEGRAKGRFTRVMVFLGFPGRAARATWNAMKAASRWTVSLPGRMWRWTKSSSIRAWEWTKSTSIAAWRYSRLHFPVGIAPRTLWQGEPSLQSAWLKLLATVLGGMVLWVAAVLITRRRMTVFSVATALIMVGLIIWALGSKYGIAVGIVAVSLTLFTLVMGEFTVQMLFRAGAIKKLDFVRYWKDAPIGRLYVNYYRDLFLTRLIPAFAVAFLVAWWPLKSRFSWLGFSGDRTMRSVELLEAAEEDAEVGTIV